MEGEKLGRRETIIGFPFSLPKPPPKALVELIQRLSSKHRSDDLNGQLGEEEEEEEEEERV